MTEFPALPSAMIATMDTDPPLTDSGICARMRQDVLLQGGSIHYREYNLTLALSVEVLQPKEQIGKLSANVKEMKEHKKGELASLPNPELPVPLNHKFS
ncbi:hypothetical protein TNCV_1941791 [Trichonephila clavipes]|uniref:Uncharacterized protein n=1 Tax=Trichonephila clavipes TaxID=2585209 RepID=A0A8X6VJB3_TRICX|nr:hypothetical protein TNCV_1941791 [Trichonephila clavipes]